VIVTGVVTVGRLIHASDDERTSISRQAPL
jgi:hypothetical protein